MFDKLVGLSALAGTVLLASPPLDAVAQTTTIAFASRAPQAPMDEYFGKLGMSPLGVGNAIASASARAALPAANGKTVHRSLTFVEDSVRDWEAKFPKDTWLPRTLLSIKHVYRACVTPGCRRDEKRIGTWLLLRYPQSSEARAVVREATVAVPVRSVSPGAAGVM